MPQAKYAQGMVFLVMNFPIWKAIDIIIPKERTWPTKARTVVAVISIT